MSNETTEYQNLVQQVALRLWDWQWGGDSFTCKLFELIGKADHNNRVKLALAFPLEVRLYEEWYELGSTKFYFKYGVKV